MRFNKKFVLALFAAIILIVCAIVLSDGSSGYSCTATISKDKLEMDSNDATYMFDGVTIQKDDDDYSAIKEYFKKQYEAGNLCHEDPTKLELQFADNIPQSITWSEYYYHLESDSFLYGNPNSTSTVENVGENAILQIGINDSIVLNSSYPPKKCYRIIRIVCRYENQMVEYYIFFG